jgi:hypothetical protein
MGSLPPAARPSRRRRWFALAALVPVLGAIPTCEVRDDGCRHCAADRESLSLYGIRVLSRVRTGETSAWCAATFGPCPGHEWLNSGHTDITGISCGGPASGVTRAYFAMQYASQHGDHPDVAALRARLEAASVSDLRAVARRIVDELMLPSQGIPPVTDRMPQ